MAKIKKFGTFSGVFTPSILTILGVIMYLRFPTIIGQAGLINTIGIIVIAHIISITTSLSVASLSTDKTVKTGGTYFMISRSLGLPIGGTLGLALFVGLSFSVSLYLIGFAESFLSYWNLDTSINSVRLTGTIILIVVTTVTFISTSLAIKSQYFIMAAIVLSLLSIFLGKHEFAPTEIHLKPLADAAPFMLLFGIFFPAVTGFEAGVSMSGDLENPKKSLPVGAMAAVGVGFVVYLGLALFYAFTVDAEALRNDSQILFKISLVPALVIIGIWGATLSSALGSILGAPRILQAIAMDKIAPKVFAKGTGKTNEPRNALLLAFVIAEAGILIGELDVIARIVSMFFITTYAFLNLASAIESWSSSDFRPAFKIPKFVSILGAVSAFIVMILLDFIALAGAVVVLGILFFYLSRKELVLESGDAWSSFWTNLAKRALLKLSAEKTNTRNWRPNIVLFSGGEQARPHLVELGISMSGKLGALTDFELVLNSNEYIQPKPIPKVQLKGTGANFFKRQFVCDTIENGIKNVTNVYGFSGFEPNTIMMGWSRDTNSAGVLANILTHVKKKNLNAVFLDYDKQNGFGKKERIDIWWNGEGRLLSFALNLMRFVLSDADWRDASIRILVINNDNKLTDKLYKNTLALLEEKRIDAEVKIISDDFGTRSKEMIINTESLNADLIILGISPKTASYTEQYIKTVSEISDLPSSILVLSPSNEFEEINILGSTVRRSKIDLPDVLAAELLPIPVLGNKIINTRIHKFDEDVLHFTNSFYEKTFHEAISNQLRLVHQLKEYFEVNNRNIEKALSTQKGIQLQKSFSKLHQSFLVFSTSYIETEGEKITVEINQLLTTGISVLLTKIGNYLHETPETILVNTITKAKKEKNVEVDYRRLLSVSLQVKLMSEVLKYLQSFEQQSLVLYSVLKNVIIQINDSYESRLKGDSAAQMDILGRREQILQDFTELARVLQQQMEACKSGLLHCVRNQSIEIGNDLSQDNLRVEINKKLKVKHVLPLEAVEIFPEEWKSKVDLLNNSLYLDCRILSEQKIINNINQNFVDKVHAILSEKVLSPISQVQANINNWRENHSGVIKNVLFDDTTEFRFIFQETFLKTSELLQRLPQEIEIANVAESNNQSEETLKQIDSVLVEPYKIARYYFDTELYEPFFRELEQLDIQVKKSRIECREANSLLKFRADNLLEHHNENEWVEKDLNQFLNSLSKQVNSEQEKLNAVINRIRFKSEQLVKNAMSPLYSHSIIDSAKKIASLLRNEKSKKFSMGYVKRLKAIQKSINNTIVNLLYGSTDSILQAKQILNKKTDTNTSVAQILDILEKVKPNGKVLTQIPVFYRTLFSSKSLINDDFWVPMEKELARIKDAVVRHKNGYGGAIAIIGNHGCGKTALTRYSTKHLFKSDRVFTIVAPTTGSVQMKDWELCLQKSIGITGDSFEIFRSLPNESVVVINDLELWWERTSDGSKIINEIVQLIQTFGKKTFFVLNCNQYSYNIINKLFSLEADMLDVINCKPFEARKLQQLIQSRHKTSGLNYVYKNKSEESVSKIQTATLFNSYFSVSGGNPGVAINSWLTNIEKVQGQNVYIKKPTLPNMEPLENMNDEWLILIALFVQHKYIDLSKLARILAINEHEAEQKIYGLLNSGMIEINGNSAYSLSRYLEPFLVKICLDKGLI
ncbi:amino acid permease [uncultured Draconibacterium sp.]|uniref:amino acid permease n=1 Tax=uncultured Draconibacterium sp. TaxID=1573823 RepID=UPI003216203E